MHYREVFETFATKYRNLMQRVRSMTCGLVRTVLMGRGRRSRDAMVGVASLANRRRDRHPGTATLPRKEVGDSLLQTSWCYPSSSTRSRSQTGQQLSPPLRILWVDVAPVKTTWPYPIPSWLQRPRSTVHPLPHYPRPPFPRHLLSASRGWTAAHSPLLWSQPHASAPPPPFGPLTPQIRPPSSLQRY